MIQSAANSLGGLVRVRAVKTLIMEGEGTNPNVGQNRNPNDPLLDWKVTEYKKTIDLAGGRMRLEQHRQAQFAFAMANDVRQNMVLDGDIAFNVDASGKASRAPEAAVRDRRIEMLDNPVAVVRAALDPGARLAHLRSEAKVQLLDLTTAKGDELTLAVDAATHLPASVRWLSSSDNLGDIPAKRSLRTMDAGGPTAEALPKSTSTITHTLHSRIKKHGGRDAKSGCASQHPETAGSEAHAANPWGRRGSGGCRARGIIRAPCTNSPIT